MNRQILPISPIGDVDFGQHLIFFFMNILAIIAGLPVLVAVYGVIRRERFFFLLGYLLYALIVVPNELGEYMATGSMERLAVAMIWTLQGILAFPNRLNYDGSKVFKSFGIKTFLCLATINIFGVALTRVMPTPPEFTEGLRTMIGVFHGVLALLPFIGIYLMASNKIPVGTND